MDRKTPREILQERGQLDKDVIAVERDGAHGRPPHAGRRRDADGADPRDGSRRASRVIRHSTAHVMADAVQRLFPGTKVTIGPAIEDGFYYDFDKPGGGFTDEDLAKIEKTMRDDHQEQHARSAARSSRATRRSRSSRRWARPSRSRSSTRIPEGEEISPLQARRRRRHEWVDVCEGPHVPSTGFLRAVKLTSVAGAYWRGDERNPMLQRIYGTAFPTQEALDEHLKLIEEAKARDHRKLGKELDLFMFDESRRRCRSSCRAARSSTTRLVDYMRDALRRATATRRSSRRRRSTRSSFETSGHLGNYNENMYRLWTEDLARGRARARADGATERRRLVKQLQDDSFAPQADELPEPLRHLRRTTPQLPRAARGASPTSGASIATSAAASSTASRACARFCQDDAHIFCTRRAGRRRDREVHQALLRGLQGVRVREDRHQARDAPREAHRHRRASGTCAEGALDGGPRARRACRSRSRPARARSTARRSSSTCRTRSSAAGSSARSSTTRTCPSASSSRTSGEDGKEHRPVMLHRAIFGSLERFFGVYLEHCGGNFPAWLAPEQAIVLTVSEKSDAYAQERARAPRARRASASTPTLGATSSARRSATRALGALSVHARRRPEGRRERHRSASARATRASSARSRSTS